MNLFELRDKKYPHCTQPPWVMILKWPLWTILAFYVILMVMVLLACISTVAEQKLGICVIGVGRQQCIIDYSKLAKSFLLDALAFPFLTLGLSSLVIWFKTLNLEWYLASAAAAGLAFYLLCVGFIFRWPIP